MKRFQKGDHLAGRCDTCGAEHREDLPVGEPYDRAVAEAALGRVTKWMEAHECRGTGPFTAEANLKEGLLP